MGIFDSLFKRKQSASNTITTPEPPKTEDHQLKEESTPLSKSELKFIEIGNLDPICPYCNSSLEKMPTRKKKCPKCGRAIYVRTRPIDRKKVLLREEQVKVIDDEWNRYHLSNKTYLGISVDSEKYQIMYNDLKKRFGQEPLTGDVYWALIQKEQLECLKSNDWGLYRNSLLEQHNLLKDEGKLKPALERLLFVCYLDVNGPRNNASFRDRPPFDLEDAFIAPGIMSMIAELRDNLGLTNDEVKDIFIKTIKEPYNKMPLSVEKSWNIIEKELPE